MKRYFFTIFILILIVFNSYSQPVEKKMTLRNEFYGAYGVGSVQEISSLFGDIFTSIFSLDNLEIKNPIGPIILGYKRNIGMNFSIGLMGSFTGYRSEYRKKDSNLLESITHNDFYTVMTRFDFIYVTNKWVQMYSGLSVGGVYCKFNTTYTDTTKGFQTNNIHLAEHINVFGIRVGHSIGGFLELGYGFNGIINLGITYKF